MTDTMIDTMTYAMIDTLETERCIDRYREIQRDIDTYR
jgi:hypothetical protein